MPQPLKLRTDAWYQGFIQHNGQTLMLANRDEKSSVLFGPPRKGKTTDYLEWSLLTNVGQALIINDPKLEHKAICGKRWRELGKRIVTLNPFPPKLAADWPHEDLSSSDFLNPLDLVEPDEPGYEDYLYSILDGMLYADGGSTFFTDNAKKFVVGGMDWACRLSAKEKLNNLTAVHSAVNATGDTRKAYCQLMTDHGGQLAKDGAAPFLVDEPNTGDLESLATACAQLQFLTIPEIARVLSGPSSFTFADLKDPNFVLDISLPEDKAKRWNRFTRTIYAVAFSGSLRLPRAPSMFVMDELAESIGGNELAQVSTGFTYGPGWGCKVLAVFHNIPQAEAVMGKQRAESILSSAGTQIFLTPNCETTAGYISRRAGTRTTFDLQYDGWFWQPNGRGIGVPVYRQHDLYGFPRNKMILFRENVSNAIEVCRAPYMSVPALNRLAQPNPYAPPQKQAVKL